MRDTLNNSHLQYRQDAYDRESTGGTKYLLSPSSNFFLRQNDEWRGIQKFKKSKY